MRNAVVRLGCLFGVLLGSSLVPPLAWAGPICGPGPHWVDTCPGGSYTFPTVTTVNAVLDLDWDGVLETGPILLQFSGSTIIFLGPGSPHSFISEIVSIDETGLFGAILRAGDGVGNLLSDGPFHSPGFGLESGSPLFVDSFFDVFFEIELSPDRKMRNLTPMQVQGCLTQAPPDPGALNGPCAPRYEVSNYPIQLFDSREPGVLRGVLLPFPPGVDVSHHIPSPEPGTMGLIGIPLAVWALLRGRRRLRS